MGALRYSVNVTVDGCCDHRVIPANVDTHRFATQNLQRADGLLFGRVTYELMEAGWRDAQVHELPAWSVPFAKAIDAAPKYVVSTTWEPTGWNSQRVTGELAEAVRRLKSTSERGLYVGGVSLPRALADLDLIDEYEFLVHPVSAGHGPTLFAGLPSHLRLELVGRREYASGAVALRYLPRR